MAVSITAIFCVSAFSQESDTAESSETDAFPEDVDIDDIFNNSEDSETPVITEQTDDKEGSIFNFSSIPLKMTGDISAEIGLGYINDNFDSSGTGYFDLVNYLYFTTRPDKYMAVKGALKTSMIDSDEADNDGNQNKFFYLYELYFDYIMSDKAYITAGKKKTVWGNIRLFSNDDDFEDDNDALYTNALYDSRYNISGILRIPFGLSTLTFLTMYRGGEDKPSYRDFSYAGSIEAVIFKTSLNVFGRTFPSRTGNLKKYFALPIIGAEVKRTILGIDFYAQGIGRVVSTRTLRKFWESDLYKKTAFQKFIFTGGFYKLFTNRFPYFGINAEFQQIYYPNDVVYYTSKATDSDTFDYLDELKKDERYIHNPDKDYETHVYEGKEAGTTENRFIVDVGLAKLGKDRNIKLGVQWYHNLTDESGYVRPAVIVSRIMPHCDWETGIKWEYEKEQEYYGKFTFGTYLKFGLDY